MNDDLMRRLRAADPAARVDLVADDAMREAIMTTSTQGTTEGRATRRRVWRRGTLAAGLAVVTIGAGAAYAAYDAWYVSPGGADVMSTDGVLCTDDWDSRGEEGGAVGGAFVTGDPVVDCQIYRQETGMPPIPDPVAFWSNHTAWVAPADQVPDDAQRQDDWSREVALRELDASLNDWVDGVRSACRPVSEAAPLVEAVVAELGIDGMEVHAARGGPDGPDHCASAYVDAARGIVSVRAEERAMGSGGWVTEGEMAALRDRLRVGIAESCLDLDAAAAVATEALGSEHHWPAAVVEDPSADCTRVDMEVGGSVQVTLRGPRP